MMTDDELREAMRASHQRDLADMRRNGIIPPWQECDILLQEDEYRLLKLIDEQISVPLDEYEEVTALVETPLFGGMPAITKRRKVTSAIGMKSDNNSAAVINRCLANGWVTEVNRHLELTDVGQDLVWDYEDEAIP